MAEPKTQRNDGDVDAFLDSIENARRRDDSIALLAIMKRLNGEDPESLEAVEARIAKT